MWPSILFRLSDHCYSAVRFGCVDDFLFGDHVYGNITGGIKPTVNDLTVNDLKNFYKANYAPNEAAISIVGDFSSADMQKQITALFSGWQKRDAVF